MKWFKYYLSKKINSITADFSSFPTNRSETRLVDDLQGATSINKFVAHAQGTLLTDFTSDSIAWREKQNLQGLRILLRLITVIGGTIKFNNAVSLIDLFLVSCKLWAKIHRCEEPSVAKIISLIKATRKANALRPRRANNLRPAAIDPVNPIPSKRSNVDRTTMVHQMMA